MLSVFVPPHTAQFCRPKGVPVIINDRVDVAIAAGGGAGAVVVPRNERANEHSPGAQTFPHQLA